MNRPKPLLILLLIPLFLVAACTPRVVKEPVPITMPPPDLAQHTYAEGSIYSQAHAVSLFEDLRARRVGDLLTVVLSERTDASKSATTSTSKEIGFGIDAGSLMEKPFEAHTLDSQKEFAGSGNSAQNNRLTGSLTVTVIDVLSNGLLVVRGSKDVVINQGRETLYVQGLVRPVDVGANNTVLSTQIANAHVAYTGSGALNDVNREGWLTRFFGSILSPL